MASLFQFNLTSAVEESPDRIVALRQGRAHEGSVRERAAPAGPDPDQEAAVLVRDLAYDSFATVAFKRVSI